MSKTTKLNFETIESPYNDNLDRGEEEMDSLADKTGLFRTSGTSEFASEVDKEVSGQDLTDLWISSWIKSRGYKPKTSGFLLDGKRGYIECMKLYVGDGGIEGGSIHIPNETADDSFHSNSYGDSWWGCNVADLAANVDNAKAYILKTGQAKFQNAAVEGTSTIDGRAATVLSAAIDASGHFADNAINTAAGTILADFTFGASGAIQIGSYVNGVSGDIKISPSGILGRNSSGATTFSINGTTGVAVLNGLVVGTNVGLGTAQDSAGVTTIIGNTVTTGYVNALNITAQYVVASISISSPTITAGTIVSAEVKTDAGSYPHAKMSSTGFVVNGQYMTIRRSNGTNGGELYADSTWGLILSSFSGEQCYINGANNLVLNAGGGTLQLRHGNTTRAHTSSDSLIIDSGMTLGGTRRTTWPSVASGANTALSNLGTTSINESLIPSSSTIDLGSAADEWNTLWLNSGSSIYWGTTSHYLIYDASGFKFSDTLNMNTKRITALGSPVNDADAVTKEWVVWYHANH